MFSEEDAINYLRPLAEKLTKVIELRPPDIRRDAWIAACHADMVVAGLINYLKNKEEGNDE